MSFASPSKDKVLQVAIDSFVPFVTDHMTFSHVKGVIERVEDPTLSGVEKKAAALKGNEEIGLELAGWLPNLLIELAVA